MEQLWNEFDPKREKKDDDLIPDPENEEAGDWDEEHHPDEEGVQYSGGDYDPRNIDTRSREYYAYAESDYSDASQELGTIPTETLFDDNEDLVNRARVPFPRPEAPAELRPKQDILDDISRQLVTGDGLDISNVRVSVNDLGEVTLEGSVRSYDARDKVEDIAQQVPGISKLANFLRVVPGGEEVRPD